MNTIEIVVPPSLNDAIVVSALTTIRAARGRGELVNLVFASERQAYATRSLCDMADAVFIRDDRGEVKIKDRNGSC